ncbi:MAG: NAD(P)/FAD-dependent oxidoreductase [Chloroflexota bacterium]|nr:NAD(P)/FAD-dependent oxidoreductase [Chloroflexota bacterium]
MAERPIIIIGGGIAGLAAGCYGQMNGYRTRILEMHASPGGLCTSWKRKGYTIDGCLHWLVGSKQGSSMNRLWEELGATQGRQMVDHEEFVRIEGVGGDVFIVYTNVDQQEDHMKRLAPGDHEPIEEMCQAIRTMAAVDMPLDVPDQAPPDAATQAELTALFEALAKYSSMTVQDFAERFASPFLRWSFAQLFDMPDCPVSALLLTLAWMHRRDAGYPIGGSAEFSRAIERRYLGLGGKIDYRSRVDKILVEGDSAVGVRVDDGEEHRADMVISAADGHATIFHMLDGRYVDDTVRGYYEELPIFPPLIQVSLGVARDLSGEPHSVAFPLEPAVRIAEKERTQLGVRHYCYDPTLAPPGKSVLAVLIESDYEYWNGLNADRNAYKAEKEEVAGAVIEQLERRFPGLRDQIEMVDVATPMTYERLTGNWRGSFEGWLITTKTMGMTMSGGMSKTLPGLDNFYMAGQWVEPGGGVPPAAMSGRNVVRMMCERDGRTFTTTVP